MKRLSKYAIIALLALSPFITYGQSLIGDKAELDIILGNIKEFSAAVVASDVEKIGAAYTKDAKIFPSNVEIIHGRDAIMDYWTPNNSNRTKYHKLMPEEIKVIGDEAYDWGYYEGISVNKEGEESSWRGKYVVIWKKVDGEWLIYVDIWNRVRT